MEEEVDAEHEDARHHGEGRCVVREGRGDEALVLVVLEWAQRDLRGRVDCREAEAAVHDAEEEDAVGVGGLEGDREVSLSVVRHGLAHVRVEHDELELHVVCGEGQPLSVAQFVQVERVRKVVLDAVDERVARDLGLVVQRDGLVGPLGVAEHLVWLRAVLAVVGHVGEAQHAALLEAPARDEVCELGVGEALIVEEPVAEELERAREDEPRVVARLHGRDEPDLAAEAHGPVGSHVLDRVGRVGRGGRRERVEGEDVARVEARADAREGHGPRVLGERGAHDALRGDHVGGGHDGVVDVVVVFDRGHVVHDERALAVELDAALERELALHLGELGASREQHVAALLHEAQQVGLAQAAERLGRREEHQVLELGHAVALQRQRVVAREERQLVPAVCRRQERWLSLL